MRNTIVGPGLLSPSDIPSDVAHTASNTALMSRTIQAISTHQPQAHYAGHQQHEHEHPPTGGAFLTRGERPDHRDRKSTRLNSSHVAISYAVFCLKKHTIKASKA